MESERFGLQEGEEDEDEDPATQYMIEQSLLESNKQKEAQKPSCGPESADSSPTFSAIRQGDEKLLKDLLLRRREEFSRADGRGWTPLHEAAAQTNQTVLELTLKGSGCGSLESRTRRGQTPLHLAVEGGLMENASFLLQRGAEADSEDQDQDTPLLLAIRSGRADLTKLLLQRGSGVNRGGGRGRGPLHEAARLGKTELVSLLLEAGALTDPRSRDGLTPLALAAQAGRREVVETLLRRGADVLSQAQDEASILYEASSSGDPEVVGLLLDFGADANVAKQTGHLPLHRVAHRGHLQALKLLIPVTSKAEVEDSGISPLHSAAAGGHPDCIKALLDAGYDPNYMLHPWVQRSYDDERKSALFFAVLNNDVPSAKLLLEAGAMANQDPIKCLQISLRVGNYELINLLLRFGANVNYYCRINTTHFPSALQYALKDEVVLRMLCNYGYDVERCFDCPYGNGSHVPEDYEGWSNSVIKDTMFCEVITVRWLKDLSGQLVRVMLDYLDHVPLCSKLKAAVMEQRQWPDICRLQENARPLQHLCRLRIRRCLGRLRLRSPVFMSFVPLPGRLKDYVMYREYDLYGRQGGVRR
uniref:Ankyrin repeat and SOCS box containing 14a n=1 Tax=Gasterosteus aculeatus aculeatus TaxID=481459 RepID=G3NIE4_GASAC|nr:dynein heavy chain 12, axonemal-like isoform X1 [Gasterosteus aculeatus aculeatus]